MASNPTPLTPGRSPRIDVPVGSILLLFGADSVGVCSTSRLPIALAKPVKLLGNGSSSTNDLQTELLEVLIEQSDCDVLGPHVGRIARPGDFA